MLQAGLAVWLATALVTSVQSQPPATKGKAAPSGQRQIEAATKAMGGAALVDGVKTLTLTGTTRRRVGATEMDMKVTTSYLFPDRYRQEMTLPVGTIVTVVNPGGAHLLMEGQPSMLPDAEKTALVNAMRRNLIAILQARKDKGYAPTLAGSAAIGNRTVDRVTVNVQGEPTTLAIARDSGQILQLSYRGPGPSGAAGDVVVNLADYRTVGGLSYPYTIEALLDGQPAFSSKLETVTVNPTLAETLFQAPAAGTP